MRVHRVRFSNAFTVAFLQARPQGVLSESHAPPPKMLVLASTALALILAPPALRGSPAARHRWPLFMSEAGECTIIGEEAGPEGKVWFACDDDGSSSIGGTECAEESFGTGGGLIILPGPDPDLSSR